MAPFYAPPHAPPVARAIARRFCALSLLRLRADRQHEASLRDNGDYAPLCFDINMARQEIPASDSDAVVKRADSMARLIN